LNILQNWGRRERGGSNGGNFETLVTFTANICHSAESGIILNRFFSNMLASERIRELLQLVDLSLDLR
jgi:hypothetical protein